MNSDEIKKIIQTFFQDNTVTIVGSGLSLAEGIPGMSGLASELQYKITPLLKEPADADIWAKISADLDSGTGLEQALHNTTPTPNIEDLIRAQTASFIGRSEANVLEDLLFHKKSLRFSEYLKHFNIRNEGLTVITTNYDRLIEFACELNGIQVDTLFIGRYFAKYSPEQCKYQFCRNIRKHGTKIAIDYAPKVTVLKPHGCLSWHLVNGEPYSIPHAPFRHSLIITPGIDKYKEGYNVPFDIHRAKANSAIDSALRYIIIGYGFNDDHLETHLVRKLETGTPALILTHSISDNARSLIKRCKNITAIYSDNKNGSIVMTNSDEYEFPDLILWDLKDMLKEVF